MDNLQKHYLVMLAGAQERLLNDGDVSKCLNTCFELRLKPDIAFFTRASVNILICDIVHFEMCSKKLDLAVEALNIATKLHEDEDLLKDAFWISRYEQLRTEAEACVTTARKEQEDYLYRMRLEEERSQEMTVVEETGRPDIGDEEAIGNKEDVETDDEDDVFIESVMFDPAGIFCLQSMFARSEENERTGPEYGSLRVGVDTPPPSQSSQDIFKTKIGRSD